jgi:L-alanine-DL-glutamate epimerase-like enolase superfamily enzyme
LPKRKLEIAVEMWPMTHPIKISGHIMAVTEVVVVRLSEGRHQGKGEAIGVFYRDDTVASMLAEIETARDGIEAGICRDELRRLMSAGGARNAIDCALWDLEAKTGNRPVWQIAGLEAPRALLTSYTISADTPVYMADTAVNALQDARAIKLKLLGDGLDASRVRAVRAARADVWMGVDANQGLTPQTLSELTPALLECGIEIIEQPFRTEDEALLDGFNSTISIAADESAQTLDDVSRVAARYDVINIKLDKCGGLTEALLMAHEARRLGLRLMVGNMGGTALAMAPAFLLGQICDIVDLDGPIFLKTDRDPPMIYRDGYVDAPTGQWGWPVQ